MNILHITAGVGKAAFGVAPVVMGLAREQQNLGHNVQIWHTDSHENEIWASQYSGLEISTFRSFAKVGPAQLCYSPEMEKAAVSEDGRYFDIVHHHGLWLAISRAAIRWRKRYNRPVVVAVHGMLEPWALGQSKWKKRIAYMLFEKNNLRNASCLHACSELEAQSIRAFGLKNPISVIPNGIDRSWITSAGDGARFRSQYGIPNSKRVMLFLSRVAPKKGIPMLMEAMKHLQFEAKDWCLVIAGAGSPDYIRQLQRQAREYGLSDLVLFIGDVYGESKRDAFACASLFVLPSHSENFGIVVAESLGAGVPVITTKSTPWSELESCGCGWWVEPDAQSIASALNKALCMTDNELVEMGKRGQELAESKYTWEKCGVTCLDVYSGCQKLTVAPASRGQDR